MDEAVNEPDDERPTDEGAPAAAERKVDERQTVASEREDPDAPGNFVDDGEADAVPEPNEPG